MVEMSSPPFSIDITRHKENSACGVNVMEDNGNVVMYLEGNGGMFICICGSCSDTLMCIEICSDIVISIKDGGDLVICIDDGCGDITMFIDIGYDIVIPINDKHTSDIVLRIEVGEEVSGCAVMSTGNGDTVLSINGSCGDIVMCIEECCGFVAAIR
ncbi:Hypothetical predicted protein [Octopus vulgaris]|uniref:Uncharacterized protein n=1 Tax=Octopus vulgaris TaxID=6645 RepID=A0AA36BB29_OCTVU|nr:Hypothetical predicted protein [Octopus vulgaris]